MSARARMTKLASVQNTSEPQTPDWAFVWDPTNLDRSIYMNAEKVHTVICPGEGKLGRRIIVDSKAQG